MVRKTMTASAAAFAAATILTLGSSEFSGAVAQEANAENSAPVPAEIAEPAELMPAFVSSEVVQPLPETGTGQYGQTPDADSLNELVSELPMDGELSEELHCLAGAVYFESRGEPLSGQLAVAQVVINRAESQQFPSSYCGVVYQRAQFSFVRGGSMPRIKTGSSAWKRAKAIARIAHRGLWESEAADSLYFHAKYVSPRWSHRKARRAAINTHIFYR